MELEQLKTENERLRREIDGIQSSLKTLEYGLERTRQQVTELERYKRKFQAACGRAYRLLTLPLRLGWQGARKMKTWCGLLFSLCFRDPARGLHPFALAANVRAMIQKKRLPLEYQLTASAQRVYDDLRHDLSR